MKKGRHRRFEEARKLKQTGPDFLFAEPSPAPDDHKSDAEDDEYADIAAKYGAFDDDEDETDGTDGAAAQH